MLKDIGHPYAEGREHYDVTFENVQAGERTSHLFRLANLNDALVVGTGDLSELALGWCTYGVGDHMSHYAVNASVPKTLIQHVIRWVAETDRFGRGRRALRCSKFSRRRSVPELVPARAGGPDPGHRGDRSVRTSLQDFNLYYTLRFGYPPPQDRVPGLLRVARSRRAARWPDIPAEQRHQYDIAEIKAQSAHLSLPLLPAQPVQAQLHPECAQGRLGRLALAARRLSRTERQRGHRLAGPARVDPGSGTLGKLYKPT